MPNFKKMGTTSLQSKSKSENWEQVLYCQNTSQEICNNFSTAKKYQAQNQEPALLCKNVIQKLGNKLSTPIISVRHWGISSLLKNIDGVGPVDYRPSTNKLHQFVWRKKSFFFLNQIKCDMWNVTCNTWQVTGDMWHMTFDMLWGWTFSKNFSSLALTVCDLWYFEDLEEKDDWVNKWIN